jgi:ribosomal-protein-alanine N-acetyltransferase
MIKRNFNPLPILTTEQLTLRQLSMADQHNIFDLRSDSENNKYLDRAPSKTIEEAINFINMVNENIKTNNSLYWAITLTKTRIFAGTICLYDFSYEKNSCEIGYELLIEFQGKGIMKEATERVIDFAFQTLGVQKIIALTHKMNQKSTNLLTKLNFLPPKEIDKENPELNVFSLTYLK